jgi:hypothetical protein
MTAALITLFVAGIVYGIWRLPATHQGTSQLKRYRARKSSAAKPEMQDERESTLAWLEGIENSRSDGNGG